MNRSHLNFILPLLAFLIICSALLANPHDNKQVWAYDLADESVINFDKAMESFKNKDYATAQRYFRICDSIDSITSEGKPDTRNCAGDWEMYCRFMQGDTSVLSLIDAFKISSPHDRRDPKVIVYDSLSMIAYNAFSSGDLPSTEKTLRDVLDYYGREFNRESYQYMDMQIGLANILMQLQRPSDAEKEFRHIIDNAETLYSGTPIKLFAYAYNGAKNCAVRTGNADDAYKYEQCQTNILRRLNNTDKREYAFTLNDLLHLTLILDKRDEVPDLITKVEKEYISVFGEKNDTTLFFRLNLLQP